MSPTNQLCTYKNKGGFTEMSEFKEHFYRDFSKFDEMSTEELNEILRQDSQLPDGEDSDTDAILYIIKSNYGLIVSVDDAEEIKFCEELFEKVRDNLDYRLSNTAQCWQANLEAPTQKSEQRDVFWNDYQKKGIDFVIKKYGTVPMKTKVKNKTILEGQYIYTKGILNIQNKSNLKK